MNDAGFLLEEVLMEDALEAIHNRRSVRAYEDKAVPKDLIDKVIDAGLWAPSGMGRQSAIVVAVADKEKISWLSELNRKIGGWKEGFDPFYGAPVVLLVLGKKDMPTYVCDGSLMIGTMGIAAEAGSWQLLDPPCEGGDRRCRKSRNGSPRSACRKAMKAWDI
jgi:nitroreductase